MAVEKVGDDESKKKRVTCNHCGAVLQYLPVDVSWSTHYDYGGGSDQVGAIQCPQCKDRIVVDRH
jgi:DNA-directed RNA polymerase subunit RPC12/RpoP